MSEIPFTLYSGAGNEFVVIDAFNTPTVFGSTKLALLAQTVCKRGGIIGADGMVVLARSARAPFQMNFYNPDGSFGALCGNGARCAVQAALDAKIIPTAETTFQVLDDIISAERPSSDTLRVHYADPKHIKLKFKLSVGGALVTTSYVDLGSQHAVIFFDEFAAIANAGIEDFDIARFGPQVRRHPDFEPKGANANFAEIRSDQLGPYIRIRTFERGVEGETLACGTGCMSTAIAAVGRGLVPSVPVRLLTQSGEFVSVGFRVEDSHVKELWLEGGVKRGRSGVLSV
ncbi:MAG: diaminopimelate epimerase [Bacteroidetes bacterium]|nr:diaminopimelate epimerase [Bacteroidota bacterium]